MKLVASTGVDVFLLFDYFYYEIIDFVYLADLMCFAVCPAIIVKLQ